MCSRPCSQASHRLGWVRVTGNTYAVCSNPTNISSRSPAVSIPPFVIVVRWQLLNSVALKQIRRVGAAAASYGRYTGQLLRCSVVLCVHQHNTDVVPACVGLHPPGCHEVMLQGRCVECCAPESPCIADFSVACVSHWQVWHPFSASAYMVEDKLPRCSSRFGWLCDALLPANELDCNAMIF